jgi:hypothetical protein
MSDRCALERREDKQGHPGDEDRKKRSTHGERGISSNQPDSLLDSVGGSSCRQEEDSIIRRGKIGHCYSSCVPDGKTLTLPAALNPDN